MLIVKNLSFQYASDTKLSFPDWEVTSKVHSLILGPSGGGKTTFLHLLGGLLKPTTGHIAIKGVALEKLSGAELDHFRGSHFGFVFQSPHLIRSLSVLENIKLAIFLGNRGNESGRVMDVMSELGIAELAHRRIDQISHGQAQRVAIARAIINEPDIIFGDEPTANLDDQSCEAVINLLISQAERHDATLIIATHDQRVKNQFKNQLEL